MKILISVGFFEIPFSNQLYVNSLNLLEIKNQILLDYTGDFELYGLMVIGLVGHKTNIRFMYMYDFESFKNKTDIAYNSEDVNFTGYVYENNTSQFNVVKRSAYAKGTN